MPANPEAKNRETACARFRRPTIDRIVQHVPIQIRITTLKPNRIFGGPSSYLGIIIPRPKARELGVLIIEATAVKILC